MDPQLLVYVQQARNAGMSDEQIAAELRKQGWQETAVSEALGLGSAEAVMPELQQPGGLPPGQYDTDTSAQPSGTSRKTFVIAAALVAVLAIGASTFVAMLATNTWSPLWSPFRPEPRTVLGAAIARSLTTDVVSVDFHYDSSLDAGEGDPVQMQVWAEGGVDVRDSELPKSMFDIGFSVASGPDVLQEQEGSILAVGGRTWGKEIPSEEFPFVGIRLPQEDDWALLHEERQVTQQDPGWDLLRTLGGFDAIGLRTVEDLPGEEFEGFPVYHYRTRLKVEDLAGIFDSLDRTVSGAFSQSGSGNDESDVSLADLFYYDTDEDIRADILIEKRSGLPVRLTLEREGRLAGNVGSISERAELTLRYPLAPEEEIEAPNVSLKKEEIESRKEEAYASLQGEDKERFDILNNLAFRFFLEDESSQLPLVPAGQCVAVADVPELLGLLPPLPWSPGALSSVLYGLSEDGSEFVFSALLPQDNAFLGGSNEKDGTVLGCECADPFLCVGS